MFCPRDVTDGWNDIHVKLEMKLFKKQAFLEWVMERYARVGMRGRLSTSRDLSSSMIDVAQCGDLTIQTQHWCLKLKSRHRAELVSTVTICLSMRGSINFTMESLLDK